MLLLSSVQYHQTFSTTPVGNSRQFYPHPQYSREHCTRSRNYRGFHIFFNPIPAGIRGFGPMPTPVQKSVLFYHLSVISAAADDPSTSTVLMVIAVTN